MRRATLSEQSCLEKFSFIICTEQAKTIKKASPGSCITIAGQREKRFVQNNR